MGGKYMKIVTVRAKGILGPILRRIFKIRNT